MSRADPIRKPAHPDGQAGQEALRRTLDALRSTGQPACDAQPSFDSMAARKIYGGGRAERAAAVVGDIDELVIQQKPRRQFDELALQRTVRCDLDEFVREYGQGALLRSHSLEPRHKVLLVGPPGNGKTSLAEALAFEAGLPFLTVRYDALVNSFLGETATRLRRLMDHASRVPCLLFFDEFDTVGKERGDRHDVGEIKRVVGSLLLHLDALASHTIVVCATNHPELLDRAVWRRFELTLKVDPPNAEALAKWLEGLGRSIGADVGRLVDTFLEVMKGSSFSDVEAFTLDVRRRLVLSKKGCSPESILSDALSRWSRRTRLEDMAVEVGLTSDSQVAKGTRRRAKVRRPKAPVPEDSFF